MLIKNTQPRLHQIGVRIPGAQVAQSVAIVNLLPGVNEVDPAQWDAATKIKMVQHYLKTKVFEVVNEADGLKAKPVSEAVELVGDTYDLNLLARWSEEDARAKVQKAIEAQIKLIHAAGDPEKKES